MVTSGEIRLFDPEAGGSGFPRSYAIEIDGQVDQTALNPEDTTIQTRCGTTVVSGFVFGGEDVITFDGGGVINIATDAETPPGISLNGQQVSRQELINMTGGQTTQNGSDNGDGGNGGGGEELLLLGLGAAWLAG